MRPCRILAITARFYPEISDLLLAGVRAKIAQFGKEQQDFGETIKDSQNVAVLEEVTVPGVLEIPTALAMAAQAIQNHQPSYDGYIVLGCVIRGETSHYDVVVGESAKGVHELSRRYLLPLGNGILTCETQEQAIERADPQQKNKGAAAAAACLDMVLLAQKFSQGLTGNFPEIYNK